MKKKIVAVLFIALMVMATAIINSYGKGVQGDGGTQAAMATVESSQGEGSNVPVSEVETTVQQPDTKPEISAAVPNASAAIEAEQRATEQVRATEYEAARAATEGVGEVKETATTTAAQSQVATGTTTAQSQETATATTAQATTTATQTSGTSKEFIALLNAKRVEMGLNPVEWDDTLAAEASKRAQEITINFSHDGANYLENIFSGNTGDINDWFEGWWASDGHRLTMMNADLNSCACCFLHKDGQYYVVFVAEEAEQFDYSSAEAYQEWKEEALESGQIQQLDGGDSDNGATVYATSNVEICTDPSIFGW